MKKIGLLFKETSANRIKENLQKSDSVFIIKYSGLSGPDLNILRQGLSGSGSSLFVVKNSVARRALGGAGWESLVSSVEGPCGLVFAREEPPSTCRVLCNFLKDHEELKLEKGLLKGRVLEKKDIEALARLPSREVLRAQVVMALNSPIVRLTVSLNQILRKFVYCLEQIKNKKT